jgi:large subunit ribosomal protein L23
MMNYRLYDVLVKQCVTEKATLAAEESLRYSFKIARSANKAIVKQAVEQIFGVKVMSVNISNTSGKVKIFKGRKGQRVQYKKAVIKVDKALKLDEFTSTHGK